MGFAWLGVPRAWGSLEFPLDIGMVNDGDGGFSWGEVPLATCMKDWRSCYSWMNNFFGELTLLDGKFQLNFVFGTP